jgi:hypothetical protein
MYSHLWLLDHGYPSSFLQDEVKVVSTVGLSVNFTAKELKPAGKLIEKAMSEAVNDAYANGESDPKLVKALLTEAGNKERRKLFGNG